jgi:glycosyltransferase involved in cell wall biosynthesis
MLLVDAVYTNNGGTKVLLDYLIEELEKTDLNIFYLLDNRIKYNHPVIKETNTIVYIKGGFFNRHRFYLNLSNQFDTIFCFSNIPPTFKVKAKVYTYFQQQLFIKVPESHPLHLKFLYFLKSLILKYSSNNSNQWIVQSNFMKKSLIKKYNLDEIDVKVIPFYPDFKAKYNSDINKEPYSYIYVSNGTSHKNHIRLITAFCTFYDQYNFGKLILTINEDYPDIINLITLKQQNNYPIENLGFLERNELQKYYNKSKYVIFPSLSESFGLGLIEGVNNGCKIISADLPYTYEVCNPSLVFNPHDTKSIFNAFVKSIESDLNYSVPKIENKIDDLLNMFNNK